MDKMRKDWTITCRVNVRQVALLALFLKNRRGKTPTNPSRCIQMALDELTEMARLNIETVPDISSAVGILKDMGFETVTLAKVVKDVASAIRAEAPKLESDELYRAVDEALASHREED